MQVFDIVISGGAMTGATLALALDRQFNGCLKIAVVEASDAVGQKHPGFDARAIALSDGSVRILQQYGLWEHILPYATAIQHIHVSDAGHTGMTDIEPEYVDLSVLGYVIELADAGLVYTELMKQTASVSLYCPQRIESVERHTDLVTVTLSDAQQIQGRLLIAADGSASTCCNLLCHPAEIYDFEQSAVIANVEMAVPHDGRAYERFTPSGPLALLPMSDSRMSMVWCMKPEQAEALLQESADFNRMLQTCFGWRLGKVMRVGHRSLYPLKLVTRSRLVSHRFVVIGNAAQTLHPIAGQGFNLGIRDVATLVESLKQQADDIGGISGLLSYQQRREVDRKRTIQMTSSLVGLFSNQWGVAEAGRNLGLMCFDQIPLLKQPLLKRTLGFVAR